MAVGCFLYCKVQGNDAYGVPRSVATTLFFRCFFGYISVACMFLAIFMLPFSLAMVLNFTQPIAATALNFIFLGEKLGYFEYAAILFSMLGVVIMTNPTAVFYWIKQDEAYGYEKSDYPYFNFGVLMALSASIASELAYLMMRMMGTSLKDGVNPLYFGTFSSYASFV